MNVSAVVIAKDEEAAIGACLDSVSWCKEIILVDSGSQDRTREIAAARGAKVHDHAWEGYGRQKKFAVEQAVNYWVLSIHGAETVSPAVRPAIERGLTHPACRAYWIARCNRFMGVGLRHGAGYPD